MCKKYIRVAAPLQYESVVDGEGLRIVLWTQGCRMQCPGCHNPQTHDENAGTEMYIDDIKLALDANYKRHRGLTFSGGDPFLQPHECKEVALYAKNVLGLDIWAYCGWTFEQLLEDPDKRELLEVCDVLVDGPYVMARRDTSLPFRGSSNQRLVDVKQSLKQGRVILYGEYR